MEDADELLKSGDVPGARAALVDKIRSRPDDVQARIFLFQLLAITGEWEKAETQLRALAQTTPDSQMLAVVYAQAIAAERVRAKAFRGEAPVPLLIGNAPWLAQLALALEAYAKNDTAAGSTLRDEAFEAAPDMPGKWNDEPFAQIADCDGRFGPAFEAILAGRWGLIGFDEVVRIKCEGPKDLRDIVWLPAEIAFKTGQSAAMLLPVRYPGTEASPDEQLRLARSTRWSDGVSGQEGLGQHQLFFDDGRELELLSLRSLVMG